ncbi:MAG TPA: TonB-dependent receptor [Thermoanaerobaculaceae bacterium]|nr:TonB-dependent receptor [Thermoanaerobaculaceae bacterium]
MHRAPMATEAPHLDSIDLERLRTGSGRQAKEHRRTPDDRQPVVTVPLNRPWAPGTGPAAASLAPAGRVRPEPPLSLTSRSIGIGVWALLVAAWATAQNPTATLTGHVSDGKAALPGVTVTVSSPSLQGTRVAGTTVEGDYIFKYLPPGEYETRFELEGFQTVTASVRLNAAQTQELDATMPLAQVAAVVTVAGSHDMVQATGTASTTYDKALIDKLPVGRDLGTAVLLTAGVVANPFAGGAISIAGAVWTQSQFMVNGVVVNENVSGQPLSLFVEDAIQEITTSVSSVSAEYGRFTGGVVNMLTRSGGNEFHGSYRDTLTNDKWTAPTPATAAPRADTINNQHEATLGGYILRDRLWFFTALRAIRTRSNAQTYFTDIPYSTGQHEQRYEAKLTLALNPSHRVLGSYLGLDHTDFGYGYIGGGIDVMDVASIYDRQRPQRLWAANYTGVLTDSFFVEGQYSRRTLTYENGGSRYTDLARGTPIDDFVNFGYSGFYNSPIFCAVCDRSAERRDNEDYLAKASWFLSTAGAGSHDLVLGWDQFHDVRAANNYQSGSGYFLYLYGAGSVFADPNHLLLDASGTPYPQVVGGADVIGWYPIFQLTGGNDFQTTSAFVNDAWRLDNHLSFNAGVRYDRNHGVNASGAVTTRDSNVSPRLGVTWDPGGDNAVQFNASYARYVAAILNTVADSSARGGQPASLSYLYAGPDINTNCDPATKANCLTAGQAIGAVFQWFNGLTQAQKDAQLVYASIPGFNVVIPRSLNSPNTQEVAVGFSARLAGKGTVRVDLVSRRFRDFYDSATTGTTVTDQFGTVYDLTLVGNDSSLLKREYRGVHVSASYRVSDSVNLGGNYTWSTLRGNYEGFGVSTPFAYPEYKAYPEYSPQGYLAADQRHRLRLFGVWDVLGAGRDRLSIGVLETYASGTPYGAAGPITMLPSYLPPGTPPYVTPPAGIFGPTYYFTARDAFRWDSLAQTDVSLTYTFVLPALGADLQFFLEPRVTNVFNAHAALGGNTSVYTASNKHYLTPFNPFTTKPVECPQSDTPSQCTALGANWQEGPEFGRPVAPTDYQTPRTVVVSLGIRF